ncbi:MAG: hypothetical protein LBT73_01440 [Tannerellaceae bacterium]|jgi:hypothetical protein|nr:hypothetical protein [Tannerellaceae bacterium]
MKRSNRVSLAALALDYSKGAFNIPVLGGVVALFFKKDDVPTFNIFLLIATGIVIILTLILISFALKPKDKDLDNDNTSK